MSIDTEHSWYDQTEAGREGPLSHAGIVELLHSGVLTPDSFVWRQGLDSWVRIAEESTFAGPAYSDDPRELFAVILRRSWQLREQRAHASRVDEVLVGAVMTSTVDNGYALTDLDSDGTHHYLRFEETGTGHRMIFQLRHLAGDLVTAQVIGHEAEVTVGYGERASSFAAVWEKLAPAAGGSGFVAVPDPGIIRIDGNPATGYLYAEVATSWNLDDYLQEKGSYRVNYDKLTRHIGAIMHCLRVYLRGRIARAGG